MKIKQIRVETLTLEQFAAANDLTLILEENAVRVIGESRFPRFRAYFENTKVQGETLIKGGTEVYGYGETVELAVIDYTERISGKTLILSEHNHLLIPRLVVEQEKIGNGTDYTGGV